MEKDRREFLEKFVALSSVSFVLTGAGCVYGPPPGGAVYGPPPIDENETNDSIESRAITISISIQNEEGKIYKDIDNVPIDFNIVVDFFPEIDDRARNRFNLIDVNRNKVISITKEIESPTRLRIIPDENEIKYNTKYMLDIQLGNIENDGELVLYNINPKANITTIHTLKVE
jgi:hypothetical protein